MEIRSSELIQELDECRSKEKYFSDSLSEKYGAGQLDPMGLKWKKKEVVYETIR
jgi:hypothetical protein